MAKLVALLACQHGSPLLGLLFFDLQLLLQLRVPFVFVGIIIVRLSYGRDVLWMRITTFVSVDFVFPDRVSSSSIIGSNEARVSDDRRRSILHFCQINKYL